MKKIMVLTIGCLIMLAGLSVCLKPRPLVVHIDEYAKNQETARSEADNARKEWKGHSEERQKAEIERLKKLAIPDLAKKAVSILARHETPDYIVNKSIDTTRNEMGVWIITPPWGNGTDPKDKKFWSIVYRDAKDKEHDWWLEQNNAWGQYRLVGNSNRIYFSIHGEAKLRTVLAYVVVFGDTKPFFQVVDGDNYVPEDYCEVIFLSEAKKIFPETMTLIEGVYNKHPHNEYALVPLKGFHASLAMDKAVECAVLLGRMGAKSVRVSRTDGEKLDAGGGTKAAVMGYRATINAELVNAIKSKMDFKVVFSGNSNVEIPETLLKNSTWYKSDSILNGIFEARRSSDNKLKEWSVTEEDQFDFNFDFKAAASVLKIGEAELKAKIERMKQTKRVFHVVF